jgi:hypothetical protein
MYPEKPLLNPVPVYTLPLGPVFNTISLFPVFAVNLPFNRQICLLFGLHLPELQLN